jgi:hypothetical protein
MKEVGLAWTVGLKEGLITVHSLTKSNTAVTIVVSSELSTAQGKG